MLDGRLHITKFMLKHETWCGITDSVSL